QPAGVTDGPLGAVVLARTLVARCFRVAILADTFCVDALKSGWDGCRLPQRVAVRERPPAADARTLTPDAYSGGILASIAGLELTHLLAIERVGPSHGRAEVPAEHRDRCHTMRGRDITNDTSPAHWLFERLRGDSRVTT